MKLRKKNPGTFRENVRRQFLIYTFIPVILLMVVLMAFFIYISKNSIRKSTNQTAGYVAQLLDQELLEYQEFALSFADSLQVVNYMAKGGKTQAIFEEFYNFNKQRRIQSYFHLFDQQGDLLLSSGRLSEDAKRTLDLFILPRIIKYGEAIFWESDQLLYQNQDQAVYVIAVPVREYGYVVFALKENDFYDLIHSIDNEVCLIADSFDHVIVSNNRRFVSVYNKVIPELTHSRSTVAINDTNYMKQGIKLDNYPLQVYAASAVTPMEELYRSILIFCLIMVAVFSALIWFFSCKIAKRTSNSIETMIEAVGHTKKGELDYRVDIDTNDEFQTLGEQFNKMQKQIERLLHNNQELMNLQREAQVKRLESQFNPHFIFNVLESLRYSLYFDQEMSRQIIESLSRLLKYSVNTSKAENTLSGDFRYLEEFLKLHKFRYGEKMSYQIEIPEELESVLVPKLILQPIVENSLKYGYRKHNSITILIRIMEQENWLNIEVMDDGGGVSDSRLAEIETSLSGAQMPGEHTGLYNSHKRLELMYGKGSGLTIYNQEEVSFTVLVKMPVRRRTDV